MNKSSHRETPRDRGGVDTSRLRELFGSHEEEKIQNNFYPRDSSRLKIDSHRSLD